MEPLLGQIQLFPYNFAPKNWMLCDGTLLPTNRNMALFSLLGQNFGGDGQTTFALPDLRGKAPAPNLEYYIAVNGDFPQRS